MTRSELQFDLDQLDFSKGGGTVTVVAQHAVSRIVLMVAHADRIALQRTMESGEMHYLSRSRGPWHKGATSGNVQRVMSLTPDCDGDSVLALVMPAGPACHRGSESCFPSAPNAPFSLQTLDHVIDARFDSMEPTSASYTARLFSDRNLRLKKLGEEATELSVACADNDPARVAEECADLIYHILVAARATGVRLSEIERVLGSRAR